MKIYLLRHAETNCNVEKIIQGTLDTHINEHGHKQAELLGQRLKEIRPSHIFCSHLQRCRETLQHVLDLQPKDVLPSVMYTPELQERYMGELQGICKQEVEEMCRASNRDKFDFGEPRTDLTRRVTEFWQDHVLPLYGEDVKLVNGSDASSDASDGWVDDNSDLHSLSSDDATEHVFLCSHGGTLLALVNALLSSFGFKAAKQMNLSRASPNTGVTILDTRTMTVEQYADISHLAQMGADEKKREEKMEVVDA